MTVDYPRIASIGTACPPCDISQEHAYTLLQQHYTSTLPPRTLEIAKKLFSHPGIQNRHFSFANSTEIVAMKNEDPDRRMDRFTRWAVQLSEKAIMHALEPLKIGPEKITCLIVNTCTGYICPGISTYLIEKMHLSRDIKSYDIVGAGCGGAIPNLQLAASLVAKGELVVSVAVEICSATFEMDDDMSLIVSNAIFSDGAAAAVLWNKPFGIALIDSQNRFFPEYREDVRYVYKHGRLHNRLSAGLPRIVQQTIPGAIITMLQEKMLSPHTIRHWALHPGGDKILNLIQQELKLTDEQIQYSKDVLMHHGNMSSPSVLFVLKEIMERGGVCPGDWGMLSAFGAGLSAYFYLLRWDEHSFAQ